MRRPLMMMMIPLFEQKIILSLSGRVLAREKDHPADTAAADAAEKS